jgi:hypothetical protein
MVRFDFVCINILWLFDFTTDFTIINPREITHKSTLISIKLFFIRVYETISSRIMFRYTAELEFGFEFIYL